jgi:hypothetical protein
MCVLLALQDQEKVPLAILCAMTKKSKLLKSLEALKGGLLNFNSRKSFWCIPRLESI